MYVLYYVAKHRTFRSKMVFLALKCAFGINQNVYLRKQGTRIFGGIKCQWPLQDIKTNKLLKLLPSKNITFTKNKKTAL